ncbi:MAG TPA: TonB-dependent receptor plug domain-containing protein [Paludibacter sp.]|nr:TonB-dependent receptor plug domain-containing protein [Paludibacter sp.]
MKTKALLLLIFSLTLSLSSFAQNSGKKYYITGQVLDTNNKPVSGATVLIDNKSIDVNTDENGMYKVKVKANAVLISIFNLSSGVVNAEINGRTVINFKLDNVQPPKNTVEKENTDNEEVNIGYGTASKRDLTTSIGTVDGKKNKYAMYQNVYELIRGEVPGVDVNGNKIRIRGLGTINGSSDPLVLVNNVEVSLESIESIDPRIVKSISILKDSDASIYGSRGANGVILITMIGK